MISTLPVSEVLTSARALPDWTDAGTRPADSAWPDSGAALTRARVAAGLTVTELARRLHVSRPTVSMWERGDRAAARSYWPALGMALGLCADEVAQLFAGSPPSRHDGRCLPSLVLARRRAGLTQRAVAGQLGVAATTISMWESRGVPVPAQLLDQLAQLLATDLAQLAALPPLPPTRPDPRPLRHLRRAAGMSQREAAAHLRIAVGTLARYETGERATPVVVVRRMATAYHRSVAEVLRASGTQLAPLPPRPWSADDLPAALAGLRSAAGLTKVELGRLVARSGQAVRTWEAGQSRPSADTCSRLEVVLGLPPGALTSSVARRITDGRNSGLAGTPGPPGSSEQGQ